MTELSINSPISDLEVLDFWNKGEKILNVLPAGDSNMNLVLRVQTNERSVILKQSKPYVRKFPQIPAPIERIDVEYQYLSRINHQENLRPYSPEVLAYYPDQHILITADLGTEGDFSKMYQADFSLNQNHAKSIFQYLNFLHQVDGLGFPGNLEMKKLNHEHIFNFPFLEENGFDLDSVQPGLQDLSMAWKRDTQLKSKITELGKRYLSTGKTLLHGDFYPGSWIESMGELKVIDPEFGFMGDAEFDLGVVLAHGDLSGNSEIIQQAFEDHYTLPYSQALLDQYHGVEILRRLIGIAQLPINFDLEAKKKLLEKGRKLILG